MRRWARLQRFWLQLPLPAYAVFLAAVGMTFCSMGFLGDIVALDTQPFSTALYSAAFAGLGAAIFAATFTRDLRWIILAIGFQAFGAWFMSGPAHHAPWVGFEHLTASRRLRYDRVGAMTAVFLGYNGFLVFIGRQGRRWVAVQAEMDLAQQIHRTLVPVIDTTLGAVQFYGIAHPSGQVGGDLVDVVELPNGEWLAYIADVSGHGVSSGLIMGMLKSAMRMGIASAPTLPVLIMNLNRLMCSQLSPQLFITLAVVRGDQTGPVEAVIAGHPPLMHLRPTRDGVEDVSSAHVPLGVVPDWTFAAEAVPFETGDLFVLITDGLFEVFNQADEDYGLDRVKSTLTEVQGLPLADIADRVVARARAFGPQLDDQTILLIRKRA